jgi:DMSO/TMAO reductase YedYZ molybdopterin-dependent catalytic subunit
MNRNRIGYIINGALFLVFILSLATGIIKFPGFLRFFGVNYSTLPTHYINLIHEWGGISLIVIIFFHLIFNWHYIARLFSFQFLILGKKIKVWYLVIVIITILTLLLSFYVQNQLSPIKQLETVQIKEYQGEKLSSIADVQDNAIKGTQIIDVNNYSLEISGLVNSPQKYNYNQVLDFQKYSKVVDINCVVGWSAKILWEGVLVKDLLNKAGIKPEVKIVIFYASDGYTTSLPLDFIMNNNIILAYKINGVVIPAEKGFPFQLVAEQKWGYKWIKWLTKIELSDNIDYKGTWESGGYNNNGDLKGPQREQ